MPAGLFGVQGACKLCKDFFISINVNITQSAARTRLEVGKSLCTLMLMDNLVYLQVVSCERRHVEIKVIFSEAHLRAVEGALVALAPN